MRTLKKALCLVLVLAMVMSLSMVAFAEDVTDGKDYTDRASIKNKVGVDVLTAIGVLAGNGDGTFGPEGNFTRAQAAKIIAYISLGKSVADALPKGYAGFEDVAADHWAAPFITYCVQEGIINGYGDGNFGPDDVLTSTQWAKMLLCALGYDAQREQMVGAGWEIPTTKLAILAKVASADDMVGTFNRDAAAKFAYNTLTADMIDYPGATDITVNGIPMTVGGVATAKDWDGSTDYTGGSGYKTDPNDATKTVKDEASKHWTLQLCEFGFKKLSKTSAPADQFGRERDQWKNDSKFITFVDKTPIATFTTKTSAGDVTAAMSGYTINASGKNNVRVNDVTKKAELGTGGSTYICSNDSKLFVNGSATYTSVYDDIHQTAGVLSFTTNATTVAAVLAGITGNGKLVQIYANDAHQVTSIVEIPYGVGKVDSITTSGAKTTYSVKPLNAGAAVQGFTTTDPNTDPTCVVTSAVAVGDIVTYAKSTVASSTLYIYPTTSFTGVQSDITTKGSGNTAIINGSSYKIADAVMDEGLDQPTELVSYLDFANSTDEANYFVDQYDCVVATTAIANLYAAVDKIALVNTQGTGSNQYAEAVLVFPDGTVETVKVKEINGVKTNAVSMHDVTTGQTKVWIDNGKLKDIQLSSVMSENTHVTDLMVKYTKNSDGTYNLTYINVKATATVGTDGSPAALTNKNNFDYSFTASASGYNIVTKGVPQIAAAANAQGSYIVTGAETVFMVKTTTSGSNPVERYAVYKGYANVPTITATSGSVSTAWSFVKNSSGKVTMVYIDALAGDVNSSTLGDIAFVAKGTTITKHGPDGAAWWTMNVIVNGEVVEIKTENSTLFAEWVAANGLYELAKDANGYVTNSSKHQAGGDGVSECMVDKNVTYEYASDTVICFNGTYYAYGADCKIYVFEKGELTGTSPSALRKGDDVYYLIEGKENEAKQKTLKAIYIIKN